MYINFVVSGIEGDEIVRLNDYKDYGYGKDTYIHTTLITYIFSFKLYFENILYW